MDARDADIDAEDAATACTAGTASSLRPKYGAVPGWFVEPSSGCTEILCEATVGQLKILHLLINQETRGVVIWHPSLSVHLSGRGARPRRPPPATGQPSARALAAR